MSRRRTGARHVPITIALKPSLVDEIETELSPNQSRSAWVSAAIQAKLDGEGWSLQRDGNAMNWFRAFKQAMDDHGVKIDYMFWDMIESNVRNHADSKANSLETTDQAESEK